MNLQQTNLFAFYHLFPLFPRFLSLSPPLSRGDLRPPVGCLVDCAHDVPKVAVLSQTGVEQAGAAALPVGSEIQIDKRSLYRNKAK